MSVSAAHCSENASHWGSLTRGSWKLHGCGSAPGCSSWPKAAGWRCHTIVHGGTVNGGKCRMAVDGGARMGALRRAGVWLGLVEDEDDRGYDDRYRYNDDQFDEEDEVDE